VTPLPSALSHASDSGLTAWRIDQKIYAKTWDSGEGARLAGGRWSSKGRRVIYCALDPATSILEVAVHRGLEVLDTVAHVLTGLVVSDTATVHVVEPRGVPNPNWLRPGNPSAGQQSFGDALLFKHGIIVIPSVVSTKSWNVVIDAEVAAGRYALLMQEAFALDPRLNPPTV
jgi:RES domain-containing protein